MTDASLERLTLFMGQVRDALPGMQEADLTSGSLKDLSLAVLDLRDALIDGVDIQPSAVEVARWAFTLWDEVKANST